MAQRTIQAVTAYTYDEDTGGVPEAEMDSFIRDQIKDHAAAVARTYDGMGHSGSLVSSLGDAETF